MLLSSLADNPAVIMKFVISWEVRSCIKDCAKRNNIVDLHAMWLFNSE